MLIYGRMEFNTALAGAGLQGLLAVGHVYAACGSRSLLLSLPDHKLSNKVTTTNDAGPGRQNLHVDFELADAQCSANVHFFIVLRTTDLQTFDVMMAGVSWICKSAERHSTTMPHSWILPFCASSSLANHRVNSDKVALEMVHCNANAHGGHAHLEVVQGWAGYITMTMNL